MNDPRNEARKRLEDEDRIRRMREGGESMRAQLAIEEAQRSRTGRETAGFSGLTPEEEERRRMMSGEGVPHAGLGETQRASMASWGKEDRGMEGGEGRTMEDRIAREIQSERRPTDVPGRTPAEQMAEMDRERQRGQTPYISSAQMPDYSRREGRVEEWPTRGEETARATRDMGEPSMGRAGGGTYYYGGREGQARGPASTEGSFGRSEHMPSRKPPIEAEPTPGERMKEKGGGMAASAGHTGERVVSKTKGASEQAIGKTKEYGRRFTERTKEATGGASAEDMASQAGESIGRGIRKVVAVGSGILAGLRRGVGDTSRERDEERRYWERGYESEEERMRSRERSEDRPYESESFRREEEREPSTGEYRETEYREVRRKDEPRR